MPDDDFAPPTPEEQQLHRALYDGNAAQPLKDAPGGGLYTYTVADAVFLRREPDLKTHTTMTPAQLQQEHANLRALATILPGADYVVNEIAEGRVDGLLADARVKSDDELDDEELTQDRQLEAWNIELKEKFAAQYGARDGEALLARTQRFVRLHPRLAALLKQHGLGSRPSIVEGIAAHVFSTGWR